MSTTTTATKKRKLLDDDDDDCETIPTQSAFGVGVTPIALPKRVAFRAVVRSSIVFGQSVVRSNDDNADDGALNDIESVVARYKCMWDTLPLRVGCYPIGCPLGTIDAFVSRKKCIERAATGEYVTFGVFCSLNCIKAYVEDRPRDSRFARTKALLCRMQRSLVDNDDDGYDTYATIVATPSPLLMKCYGGQLTESEYRLVVDERKRYDETGVLKQFSLCCVFENGGGGGNGSGGVAPPSR